MKAKANQRVETRKPRQQRSRYTVELILEATMRLLEKGSPDGLTTNAVAAAAGVSIGSLYQYFPNKAAILDALADREVAEMSQRVMAVMADRTIPSPRARIAAVVRAVAASYGTRQAAHRFVMAHSLARGGNRLSPLLSHLKARLSTEGPVGGLTGPIDRADAFVVAHSFAGVLRAMISEGDDAPPQDDIEDALARLVVSFLG